MLFYATRGCLKKCLRLRLNYEAPERDILTRKLMRRLMQTLYVIDTRLAGGMSEFAPCSVSSIYVRGFEYDLLQATQNFFIKSGIILTESTDFLAIWIRLMWLHH